MVKLILLFTLFVCINAAGQKNDSLLKIMEERALNEESIAGKLTGKTMPDFTAKDLNGYTYTGKMLREGKVTFLDFWYLGCQPCIAEMPNLNRLFLLTKTNANFQFLSITYEPEEHVKEAIKKYDIHFPILIVSPQDIYKLTFARGYPTNMVVDPKGTIYSFLSGGSFHPGEEFEVYWKWQIDKALMQ